LGLEFREIRYTIPNVPADTIAAEATTPKLLHLKTKTQKMKKTWPKSQVIGLWLLFVFLEELLNRAKPCFLRQNIACNNRERFFRTPLNTLRSVRAELAKVTNVNGFGFRVHHHGAVVAGFNAPAAAVALVFVDYDAAGFQ
jgi:hypothetical protein